MLKCNHVPHPTDHHCQETGAVEGQVLVRSLPGSQSGRTDGGRPRVSHHGCACRRWRSVQSDVRPFGVEGQSDCIPHPLVESSGEVSQVKNKPAADDKIWREGGEIFGTHLFLVFHELLPLFLLCNVKAIKWNTSPCLSVDQGPREHSEVCRRAEPTIT